MEVSGWSWEEGDRLVRYVTRPDKNNPGQVLGEWVPVLPFNVVPVRALRENDTIKVVEVDVVFVNGRVRRVQLPTTLISTNRPAQVLEQETGIDIAHKEAVELAAFLEVIATEASTVPEETVITTAEWDGDELKVPGRFEVSPRRVFAELAKYGGTHGGEDAARDNWRDVLRLAAHPGNEKLLLALGMPLGSIYAARLRRAPYRLNTATFALHLTGDSAKGKTQAAISAMMTLGDTTEKSAAANLYRTWDMSAQAPVALAHRLGILPLYFDEAATSQKTPEEFTTMLFALAQGTERQRATVTGDVDDVDRWECCVLSTGEMRLTAKSGLVGVRRRIQELYAPFAPQAHCDEVFRLASESYGWPLWWLAENPQVDAAAGLFPQIESSFDDAITWLNAAAANLSVCGLGALMLARHLDVSSVTVERVHDAVRTVVEKAGRAAVEEGVDVGIKLLKAVWDAHDTRPLNFPVEGSPFMGRDREGIRFRDGTLAVISRQGLAKIARDAGLPDYQSGIRILAADGLMLTERNRDQVFRVVMAPDGTQERRRVYVFKQLPERDR